MLELVDGLPPEEPLLLLGDLNAHIGSMPEFLACQCPLHGEPNLPLDGCTCSRGRMVLRSVLSRGLRVLNGCKHLQRHTCTTK